ncbi:hypothetical protein MTBUT4_490006 [Magnetospirillum sp. UT-4]|nr:hypothetical protein MTBUT4_490006 [Magnetospirillum sp. UT-4]
MPEARKISARRSSSSSGAKTPSDHSIGVANMTATAPTIPMRVHPPGRSHVKRIVDIPVPLWCLAAIVGIPGPGRNRHHIRPAAPRRGKKAVTIPCPGLYFLDTHGPPRCGDRRIRGSRRWRQGAPLTRSR